MDESNRPIVECFFTYSRGSLILRIENEGNLIAKNIQIRSPEPFFNEESYYGKGQLEQMMTSTFDIAPSEHFDIYLTNSNKLMEDTKNHNYTITYENGKHKYCQESSINFSEYSWTTYSPDVLSVLEQIKNKL